MKSTSLVAVVLGISIAACSDGGGSTDGDGSGASGVTGAGNGNGNGTGAGHGTGAQAGATSSGTGGKYEPPPESQTITFGPLDVPPYEEHTQCIVKRLGNTAPMYVHQMHNELTGVSHHLIVYKVSDTEEQLDPFDCQPFADTLSGSDEPMMITQKHSETLALPEGVAFSLAANQMIRLEVHYINASGTAQSIQADSTFESMDAADFQNEAGFVFAGTLNVSLPPNQATDVHAFIPMPGDLDGKNFFGFTGHVHKFGTNVTVAKGTQGGSLEPVYAPTNFTWSEPPTEYHDPPVVLGGGEGFDLTCNYQNTSSSYVGFGESANDEMCFFWSYYYPSVGPKVIF